MVKVTNIFIILIMIINCILFVSANRFNVTSLCPQTLAGGLIYCEDFEDSDDDWKEDFRSGTWNVPESDLVKKVSYNCLSGNYCIRSNLRESIIDPITNSVGNPNLQFEWAPDVVEGLDEVFFRYWYRLDDAQWSGIDDRSNVIEGANSIGKIFYITDQLESTRAYFMGSLGRTIAENGAYTNYYRDHPELWGQYYELGGRTSMYANDTSEIIGPDGSWHKVELYFNHNEDYMKIWFDDILFTSVNLDGPTDGVIDTYPDFLVRGLQFWYTRESYLETSVDGPETAGGFEIDNLEIWNYNVKEASVEAENLSQINLTTNNITVDTNTNTETYHSNEVVIDNDNISQISYSTDWSLSTYYPNYYGENYMYSSNSANDWFKWTTNLEKGVYQVYTWYTSVSGRPIDAIYSINNTLRISNVTINQELNGGQWYYLGEYNFDGEVSIKLVSTESLEGACADAIKFVKVANASVDINYIINDIDKWKSGEISIQELIETIKLWGEKN